MTYYVPGGGFRHILDGNLDGMATEQAYYALVSYRRMLEEKTSLYDMTDVIDQDADSREEEETTEPTAETEEPVQDTDTGGNWWPVALLFAGVCTLYALVGINRKKLFG